MAASLKMSDREKVIKGIQECDLNGGLIGNCPYKGIVLLLKEHEDLEKRHNAVVEAADKMYLDLKEAKARIAMLDHGFKPADVVRCKDCIHWIHGKITDKDYLSQTSCDVLGGVWHSYDFCSCAEQKSPQNSALTGKGDDV